MIYNTQTLEFDKIIIQLMAYAQSDAAKHKLSNLKPYLKEKEVVAKTKETTEARKILDNFGNPPICAMKELNKIIDLVERQACLTPEQLNHIGQFIAYCRRLKAYLKKAQSINVDLAFYDSSLMDVDLLYTEIERSIRNNAVDCYASTELKNLYRAIENANQQIKIKLDAMLKAKKEYFTDSFVSMRNNHYVLPVKKEYKHQISGSVIDISATGTTYFIEPSAISKLQAEVAQLLMAKNNEELKILYTLTSLVYENLASIKLNMQMMETIDFIFAKAKLSADMKAVAASINTHHTIKITSGKHPLLNQSECVPLDFEIGNGINGIVITGPNTGGKTVALKTVGLLSTMAQCGLHIPCKQADICMNNAILCDIGDNQSITENLSTFSAHITNIIGILNCATAESLVLLDELGSGTDPVEGMGIAIAILEELKNKKCLFIATTHYPEVKEYTAKTEGLINAKMTFDRESLKPLYKLQIGEAGESCALYIAKRLGLPKKMLELAYQQAYCRDNEHTIQKHDIDLSFINDAKEKLETITAPKLEKEKPKKQTSEHALKFNIGDSVVVYPQKKIGIVYQKANENGEIGVQIQKKKQLVNHKHLQLKTAATELYPPNYDFSIVFDTVENRKARHKMTKGHQEGLVIEYENGVNGNEYH